MNSNPSRITVTLRGKKLQDDLRIETAEDFYLQATSTRSIMPSDSNYGVPLTTSNSETTRAGYFRPKYESHAIIKIPDSQKVYPNYMKKDPREYTTKHVCAWTPKSTTEGPLKLPASYASNQSVHHTLWKPELDGIIRNANIKDTNSMISGRFGYIPLHMTNCKYPESKFILNTEGGEISRMLSPVNGSQRDLNSSKCMSDMSVTMTSGFRGRDNNFKSSLISTTTSHFGLKNNLQKRRNINHNYSSTGRVETSMLSAMNTSMNRIFMRSSDEKIEQIIGKQKRSQKEYEEILDRVGEKIRQKYDRQEESASYLPELKDKLQKEKATLEELTVDRDREKARYQGRLLERSNLKYGKTWKNHSSFLSKCGSQKEIEPQKESSNKTNSVTQKINFLKRVTEGEAPSSPIPVIKRGYTFAQNDSSFHPKDDLGLQKILPSYNKL